MSVVNQILYYPSTFLSSFMCIGGGKMIVCHVVVPAFKNDSFGFYLS